MKEQEEKGKKGGKKESKEEEKPVEEEDPEEAERKRLEWEALSEEEKFYRTSEDPYKSFSLVFGENSKSMNFDAEQILDLESKIDNNEVKVVLTRKPNMNKE